MVKDKIKILMRGAQDSFNFGDDLIFIAIVDFLKQNLKLNENDLEIYTQRNSYSLEELDYKFDLKLMKSREINDVIDSINSRLKVLRIPKLLRIFLAVCILGMFFMDSYIFKVTRKCLFFKNIITFFNNLDVLHYIGGGYITDRWKTRIIYEYLTVNVAKRINPNLMIIGTGLGLGPFKYGIFLFLLKGFLGKFDYLFLREKQSFNLIKKLNVTAYARCLGDDALLLLPIFENLRYQRSRHSEEIIAINLKSFPDHRYDIIRDVIDNLLNVLSEKNFKVEYFCFGQYPGPDDYNVMKKLHLNNRIVISAIHNPYEEGFDNFIKNLSKVKFGFGFAYHFNVILTIMSILSISIYSGDYYKQKIEGSMELFNMPFVFSFNDVKNHALEISITNILEMQWNEEDRIRNLYRNMIEEYAVMYKELIERVK